MRSTTGVKMDMSKNDTPKREHTEGVVTLIRTERAMHKPCSHQHRVPDRSGPSLIQSAR